MSLRKKIKSLNYGDFTSDNIISLADVIFLARSVLTGDTSSIPDFSGDGQVGMADIIVLARYVVGTLSVF